MIVILDYGMGNPSSILNMIRKVGGSAVISIDAEVILKATAIILPGVGSFDNGIKKLRSTGIIDILEKRVLRDNIPFLGICLGMQLLFESSEEGVLPGLGFIKGRVSKFNITDTNKKLKIPHMGWNVVTVSKEESKLFKGLDNEIRFYFVHSFHVECDNHADIIATTEYGYKFTCCIQHENIYAAQFHPEKSHKFGMVFFKNFLELLC